MADLMKPIINPVRNARFWTWSAPHCRVTRSPIALGTSPHRQNVQCSICSICSTSTRSWIVGSIIIVALIAIGKLQDRAFARLVHADEPSDLFASLVVAHALPLEDARQLPDFDQLLDFLDVLFALVAVACNVELQLFG